MVKREKPTPKGTSLHGRIKNGAFNLEIPGESLIAMHNALAFTLSNKDLYSEAIEECSHCMEAMGDMRHNIEQILQYAEIYDKNKGKLAN